MVQPNLLADVLDFDTEFYVHFLHQNEVSELFGIAGLASRYPDFQLTNASQVVLSDVVYGLLQMKPLKFKVRHQHFRDLHGLLLWTRVRRLLRCLQMIP